MTQTTVYILIPIVSALIGWLTNFIAVRMIFRPRRSVNVLGLKIQGLMPRRQADLAHKVGETVEAKLLTHDDIAESLRNPEIQAEIESLIGRQIDEFFNEKLGANPMISMFLQGEMAQKIKGLLVDQLEGALPDLIDTIVSKGQETMDLKAIVQKKIEDFDLSTLETIVYDIASRELKLIEVVGGVLGFLVGLGQVGLLLLANGVG